MIEFMKENPGWTFLYLLLICCAVETCFECIARAIKKRNKD